jgi:hypothetical protein
MKRERTKDDGTGGRDEKRGMKEGESVGGRMRERERERERDRSRL